MVGTQKASTASSTCMLQYQCLCSELCQYCNLADCKRSGVHKGRATTGGIDLPFTTALSGFLVGNVQKDLNSDLLLLNFVPKF